MLASLASIALGLVVMVTFDLVIPAGETATLLVLAVGFLIALAADLAARSLIARGVAGLGDRAGAVRRLAAAVMAMASCS